MEIESWQVVMIVMNIILAIITLFSNTLTLIAIYKTRALRTIPNMYIASLTVADLLTVFVDVGIILFHLPYTRHIYGDKYVCLSFFAITYIIISLSLGMMLTVAIDRFFHIRFPFAYQLWVTKSRAAFFISATWSFAMLNGGAVYFDNNWENRNTVCNYMIALTTARKYIFVLGYTFILIITISCYGYISCVALKQRRMIRAQEINPKAPTAEGKSILLYFIVFCVFLVCWMPTNICTIIGMYGPPLPLPVIHFTFTTGMLNSSFNFIVYGLKNKDFRNAYKNILCKGRQCDEIKT